MPLVSMKEMLERARSRGYAVCYCEAWNLESLQAVIEAAEGMRSPIIAGFNGGFLMHPGRAKPENLAFYAGLGLALRQSEVPTVFLLNETDSLAQIEEGIELGFNAVMVENEHLRLDEYRSLVKQVVKIARAHNVSVEAQIGRLRDAAKGVSEELTDPAVARAFVEETGVDALGVAVGNVHVLTAGKAVVKLEILEKIRREVNIPLVLHGGTGIPLGLAQTFIRLGVAKINFGTVLKQAYLTAVRKKFAEYREPSNPHPFLGMGGSEDLLVAGREAVRLKVEELLQAFGSSGQADKR